LVDKAGRQVGFDFSPLRLNQFVKKQSRWGQAEIEERGKDLATRAVAIWPSLDVDVSSVRMTELEEMKAEAANRTIEELEFNSETRKLFDELRKQILAVGSDIIELPGQNTVTYRVYDFFVEVIPRKRRLALVLNLDFDEADDPTQRAIDANERAFVIHATESGGVIFRIEQAEHISAAMRLVRQAYEKVSE
jgi:predicted transport protein